MKTLGAILWIVGMLFVIYPTIFWFQNPELTQMQVLKEVWWSVAIGLTVTPLGFYLYTKNKRKQP